jgi:predicted DsbA family dithiol-disulfide isomerase
MPTVTVFSDFICPFCYLGERSVKPALEALGLALDWRAYEIHPEIPPEGVPAGRLDRSLIDRAWTRVLTLASDLEIPIERPDVLPSSRLALEGSEHAREAGRLDPYRERVFAGYFLEGRNIGDPDVLAGLAADAGLDARAFREALDSRRHREAVTEAREAAEELLVTGVPTFFLHGVPVVGAQSSDEFLRHFSRILERRAARDARSQ